MAFKMSLSVTMAHTSPVWGLLNLLGRMVLSTNWSAPNHQASYGQAGSSVKIKSGLKRMSDRTLETKLSRFLLSYKTALYTTTEITPAELLKKEVTENLDRLRLSTSTTVLLGQDHQKFHHG